jgi:hypothetical protein
MEDDKEIYVLSKRCGKMMDSENDTEQDSNSWFNLFEQSYISEVLAFFEGCIVVEWSGVQEAHFLWLVRRNNTGKRWATALVVKLLEITWDLWDHHNQIKFNLEMAQDLARRDSIILSVRSEYAFGRSGRPRRDWRLFKRPLVSLLTSSLHYLDAWLLI